MDLNDVDVVTGANKGFTLTLFHPVTQLDTDMKITVLGQDSDKFKELVGAQNQERVKKLTKGGQFRAKVATLKEIESNSIQILAGCTTGWENVCEGKDQETKAPLPLPFSLENAVSLYTKYPWIKEQVDEAIGNRANFMPSSSKP